VLHRDAEGNVIAPRFDRLVFFDVIGRPDGAHARLLEAHLRSLERSFAWGPAGLLFTVGWSPGYFERRLGVHAPLPYAKALSDFELPAIDDYDLCLHLACDEDRRLSDVVQALLAGSLPRILRWRETRTGFTGPGLPAARQDVGGIPPGGVVPASAPLYMGFRSALRRNQASETDVTIAEGPFAGGTTQAVSYMRLALDSWYRGLSERDRVARMYAPQVTPAQAAAFTTDAASDPAGYAEAVSKYGVVGHAQTSARARRGGRPIILRRDFNTTDGAQAGLHFVSLQRSIEDFVTVRTAMNASAAQLANPSITSTVNNGINEFIFVVRRANYLLPPRRLRAFPLVPGREEALRA
jgi:hypothetical protein